jgi:RNA polymerase sigma-70 factor (ECF subfamily)
MGPLRRISAVKPGAQEFVEAAERHLDDVHAFLIYLTGDRNVAEELTAETFARACERWRRYDPRRGSARTWLCQLARSTALDHFRAEDRRRRREGRYALDVPEAEEPVFGEGLSPALEAALSRLSAAEREVVALRVVLDLDGESASRVLGISTTACSTRLSRALQKLEREVSAGVAA